MAEMTSDKNDAPRQLKNSMTSDAAPDNPADALDPAEPGLSNSHSNDSLRAMAMGVVRLNAPLLKEPLE